MVRNCFRFCRIICVMLVMSGAFCVISLSSIIVIRYNANYLSTTMDNAHHSVADIPFPAVTLCHYNRIDIRKVDGAFEKWVAYLDCIFTRSSIWLHSHRILYTVYNVQRIHTQFTLETLTTDPIHCPCPFAYAHTRFMPNASHFKKKMFDLLLLRLNGIRFGSFSKLSQMNSYDYRSMDHLNLSEVYQAVSFQPANHMNFNVLRPSISIVAFRQHIRARI